MSNFDSGVNGNNILGLGRGSRQEYLYVVFLLANEISIVVVVYDTLCDTHLDSLYSDVQASPRHHLEPSQEFGTDREASCALGLILYVSINWLKLLIFSPISAFN